MGAHYIKDPQISVGGTDLTGNLRSISWDETTAELDATTAGSGGNVERIGGLNDGGIEVVFTQDFDDDKTYHALKALKGTLAEVVFKPHAGAAGPRNPERTVMCFIRNVPQIDGAINELSTVRVSWPFSGAITVVDT